MPKCLHPKYDEVFLFMIRLNILKLEVGKLTDVAVAHGG